MTDGLLAVLAYGLLDLLIFVRLSNNMRFSFLSRFELFLVKINMCFFLQQLYLDWTKERTARLEAQMPCPSFSELVDHWLCALPMSRDDEVARHLDRCQTCLHKLDQIHSGPTLAC